MQLLEESVDMGYAAVDALGAGNCKLSSKTQAAQKPFRPRSAPSPTATVGTAMQSALVHLNSHEFDLEDLKQKMDVLWKENQQNANDPNLKAMKHKLKSIAESTSSACHSVSESVSDLQESTIQVYSWAEKVHAAFGILSEKVAIRPNPCPRLHVLPRQTYHATSPPRDRSEFESPSRNHGHREHYNHYSREHRHHNIPQRDSSRHEINAQEGYYHSTRDHSRRNFAPGAGRTECW